MFLINRLPPDVSYIKFTGHPWVNSSGFDIPELYLTPPYNPTNGTVLNPDASGMPSPLRYDYLATVDYITAFVELTATFLSPGTVFIDNSSVPMTPAMIMAQLGVTQLPNTSYAISDVPTQTYYLQPGVMNPFHVVSLQDGYATHDSKAETDATWSDAGSRRCKC